jgi:hypothetical protein
MDVLATYILECTVKKTNKFEEPLNKVLEILILVIVGALGVVVFLNIMTPNNSSILFQSNNFFRFGLFTVTLFLIMYFIATPLFNMLKMQK